MDSLMRSRRGKPRSSKRHHKTYPLIDLSEPAAGVRILDMLPPPMQTLVLLENTPRPLSRRVILVASPSLYYWRKGNLYSTDWRDHLSSAPLDRPHVRGLALLNKPTAPRVLAAVYYPVRWLAHAWVGATLHPDPFFLEQWAGPIATPMMRLFLQAWANRWDSNPTTDTYTHKEWDKDWSRFEK